MTDPSPPSGPTATHGPSHDVPVALVTGAAVRVGRAIATELAAAGYRVWLHHHRSVEQAQALHVELSRRDPNALPPIAADLCDEADRARLADAVLDPAGPGAGRLDLLVNNAASFERGAFTDRSDADLRRVLELNLVAPLSLVRRLAPGLARADGNVVNILDVGGVHPWPEHLDHCVAKAALSTATQGLAVELAPVRVNAVAPGTVAWPERLRDPAHQRTVVERIPRGRIGEPEDVARAVLFFARSPHVTGQVLAVDGGLLAAVGGRRP
ncbi:MAG: SDR family oxidoreductase [Deltaproteobacteria bacterium]|nr:SDR family oxidoreductase [Deltaproteobacteria bacterium]